MSGKVHTILLETLLERAQSQGVLPWQKPYEMFNSFNWLTKKTYSGVNRLLLPSGEYLTFNQAKKNGFTLDPSGKGKGNIVVFYKKYEVEADPSEKGAIQNENGHWVTERLVLRYYRVWEISYFKDASGRSPQSRLSSGELVITREKPQKLAKDYLEREKIQVINSIGPPYYDRSKDVIGMNPRHVNESEYWSSLFHEIAHSTAHKSRLNRSGDGRHRNEYAFEELIAEITSSMLCAESELLDGDEAILNNQASYLNGWLKALKDNPEWLTKAAAQAERAFQFVTDISYGEVAK